MAAAVSAKGCPGLMYGVGGSASLKSRTAGLRAGGGETHLIERFPSAVGLAVGEFLYSVIGLLLYICGTQYPDVNANI